MGQEDRDWYRERAARRNSADEADLFPNHRWATVRSTIFPTALAVLAVLALLVLGLRQGWFDRGGRSHAAAAEAEIAALRAGEPDRPPSVRTPQAAPRRSALPDQPTFHERYREPIELTLLAFAILSPFVVLGFLIALFIRRLAVAALIGLLLGPLMATVSGHLYVRGLWFDWGVLYPADSMGAVFQFFEVIAASFAMAAIAGAIAVLILGKAYRLRERGRPARATVVDGGS